MKQKFAKSVVLLIVFGALLGLLTACSVDDYLTSIAKSILKVKYEYSDDGDLVLVKVWDKSITNCKVRDQTKIIYGYAFNGCDNLTSVTIPDSVTTIGGFAFGGCHSLKNIVIPDSVILIGYGAFYECGNLTYNTYDNALYLGNTEHPYLVLMKATNREITSCEISDQTKIIYNGAFHNCSNLQSITIPDNVTCIGEYAFSRCTGLTSVTIPDSVMYIFDGAFSGCTGLTSVTIPDSVMYIFDGAFSGCTGLTSVTIGNGVTSIGDGVFQGCSGLTSIEVAGGNTVYHADGNCLIETASHTLIVGCQTSIIPTDGSVTAIGDVAFYGCGLTSITIPNGVTSIGDSAFDGCPIEEATLPTNAISSIPKSALTTVVITGGDRIGSEAFSQCTGLTSIMIPDSVTSIGRSAFKGCSILTSITIPDSVTRIRENSFSGCSSLTSITFDGSTAQWNAIEKASEWNEGWSGKVICTDGELSY